MPLDYLNEASDEVQRLFTRLDNEERTLRQAVYDESRPSTEQFDPVLLAHLTVSYRIEF